MWKVFLLIFAVFCILASFSVAEDATEQEASQSNGENSGAEDELSNDLQQVRQGITYSLGPLVQSNWYQARLLCKADGRQLASINDADDYKAIIAFMLEQDLNYSGYWLAGTKINGPWLWSNTTERIVFKQWARGEPRLNTGSCMEMKDNYKWYASRCTKKLYAICEKTG